MSKHTPGPWIIDAPESDKPLIYSAERFENASLHKRNWRVAIVCAPAWNSEADWAEARATARLIAAAPDLLTAVEGLVTAFDNRLGWDHYISTMKRLRAAIAKAKGAEE